MVSAEAGLHSTPIGMPHVSMPGQMQGCSSEAWRTLTRALVKSMKDKVANVLSAAMTVTAAMADAAPAMDARDAAMLANELTPPLVDKVHIPCPAMESVMHMWCDDPTSALSQPWQLRTRCLPCLPVGSWGSSAFPVQSKMCVLGPA